MVNWYWDILGELEEKELKRYLQFCTGTSRVPIGGFSVIESNRGTISPFTIVKVTYKPNLRNFIKAHTCFNRVDLPDYPSKDKLKEAIDFITKNEILGFGID